MEKQEQIYRAALALFAQYGFHGTPTSRIAQEAGVSNGTLFHYFKTKEELIIALYNKIKNDISQYLSADLNPEERFELTFKRLFMKSLYWAIDNPQAFFYIQQVHVSPHYEQVPADVIMEQTRSHRQLIERGLAEGALKPMSVELIYTLLSSQVFGVYQFLTATEQTEADQKQVIQQAADLVWHMLKA